MKKRTLTKILTLLLTLCILSVSVMPIFAASITTDSEVLTGEDIVKEDETKRERFSKHFLTGDGSYFAVAYASPVNYMDDDGTWKEVDNTMTTNIFTGDKTTKNDKFKVKFSNKANKDKLVTIQTDEFKVSWGLSISGDGENYGKLSSVKGAASYDASEPKTTKEATKLGKAVSSMKYENVYDGKVDLQYSVSHEKVKENVVLKEKTDFVSYRVTYNIKDTATELLSDGSVIFRDTDGNVLFEVGAPLMWDEAGESSSDIAVSVEHTSKKTVEITYTPSAEWLNSDERVYPIVVDPYMETSQETSNIMDTRGYYYYPLDAQYEATAPALIVGFDYLVYLKILNVPLLPAGMTVQSANLVIYGSDLQIPTDGADDLFYGLGKVTQSWTDELFVSDDEEYNERVNPDNAYEMFGAGNFPSVSMYAYYDVYEDIVYDWNGIYYSNLDIPSDFWNTSGGYNQYFSTYKGFQISLDYRCGWQLYSGDFYDEYYRPSLSVRYSVPSGPNISSDNFYRIKNKYTGKYLTIGTDNATGITNVYQSNLIPDPSSQVFKFEYSHVRGAYQIRTYSSVISNSDNGYINFDPSQFPYMLPSNYSNAEIGQDIYNWIISAVDSTSVSAGYTITYTNMPSFGLRAYGAKNGTPQNTGQNNGNIGVGYTAAGANGSAWVFERYDVPANLALNMVGIREENFNNHVTSVTSNFVGLGYDPNDDMYINTDMSYDVDEFISMLENAEISIVSSHGEQNAINITYEGIQITGSDFKTYVQTQSEEYGQENYYQYVDLSHVELVVLSTCLNASGVGYNDTVVVVSPTSSPRNMMEMLIKCGVKCVIAFEDEVGEIDGSEFCIDLFTQLNSKVNNKYLTLEQALIAIYDEGGYSTIPWANVVVGVREAGMEDRTLEDMLSAYREDNYGT